VFKAEDITCAVVEEHQLAEEYLRGRLSPEDPCVRGLLGVPPASSGRGLRPPATPWPREAADPASGPGPTVLMPASRLSCRGRPGRPATPPQGAPDARGRSGCDAGSAGRHTCPPAVVVARRTRTIRAAALLPPRAAGFEAGEPGVSRRHAALRSGRLRGGTSRPRVRGPSRASRRRAAAVPGHLSAAHRPHGGRQRAPGRRRRATRPTSSGPTYLAKGLPGGRRPAALQLESTIRLQAT
jgi:hypothetical protein